MRRHLNKQHKNFPFSPPTSYMNKYTFFRDSDDFIESNIFYFINT